ncbi:SUMF1/EgtB/PvdO family nonheme iron enzyme [Hymenobacter sp. 5516J-16]|uniref:SUMF1/EgtB/PvdO family nonheme iron enzyme n=1 Tax=Hymenobacter sp. 5516J-16 TaxID=2932253 RepID=UPI001FD15E88|nr:SUMF1/EgtB/PvdO family nonheme iron enzyme [Hymenobacter sp. 5516J-16]UOQ76617.1 SUMF1/EgtB/PvdO family nonheme iron enzyme [Hymenobacter sp. 5516J-16]
MKNKSNVCAAVGLILLLPAFIWAQGTRTGATQPALPEPPGTTRVAENLFMDETEVANIHWLEYLHFLRRDSTLALYRSQLPDSTGWQPVVDPEQDQAPQSYFRAPGYRYYPATNISYEQAQAYCRWRSAAVNRAYFQGAEFRKQHPELRDYAVTVTYRLPTEQEWQLAAAGGVGAGPRPFEVIQTRPVRKPKGQKLAQADVLTACLDAQQLPHPAEEVAYALPFNLRENYYLAGSNQVFKCARPRRYSRSSASPTGRPIILACSR